ncbi:hypothetical protein BFL38_14245 [Brachyspira hampsonii]|uniref:Uncharacterized protein n=1 Tax=Brachyspira hampsonii TaxID=1287055 RepID=A0A1E5NH02_9SPIR|nr:hypothetical protein [Brachyspira hampsonii]OEJ15445.1 hypothetical protein BFL38_14245 [Brachyspira hampsonii]
MKVEDLKKDLTSQIKNLIFTIFKDFNISNTDIDVYFQNYHCSIYVKNTLLTIYIEYAFDLGYDDLYISIHSQLNSKIYHNRAFIPVYCSLEEYMKFIDKKTILDSELIQIIKTLYYNKELLKKELKNILE